MSWAEFFPQECEQKHVSLFKRPIMMVQTTKSVVQICQFLEVFKMCLRHFPFLILNYNKIKRCLISDKIKKNGHSITHWFYWTSQSVCKGFPFRTKMKNIQHDILEEYLDLEDLFTFRIMISSKHFSFSVLSGPTSFLFSRAVCLSLLGRFKCRC